MIDYRTLGLLELFRRIAQHGDRVALREFHKHRTIFDVGSGPELLFGEYVDYLRDRIGDSPSWKHIDMDTVKKAYDNTIDRFLNLPGPQRRRKNRKPSTLKKSKRQGPDCRRYFRGFLSSVKSKFEGSPTPGHIETERRTARLMQGYVKKHFYLCLNESSRSGDRCTSRYDWRVRGRIIRLWFPVHIRGRERREWLEEHVLDPDPARPNERERIQAMIYELLVPAREVPYSSREGVIADTAQASVQPTESALEGVPQPDLVEYTANEKARAIDLQPPSIRALERRKLKALVRAVLNNLLDPKMTDEELARKFSLTKSSFSRYAGRDWIKLLAGQEHRKQRKIPTLWHNLAQILSANPVFMDAARKARVLPKVEQVIRSSQSSTLKRD